MPAVLLTTGNIRALKAGLREGLPQIKSSHLSEALAYGVGFRTHAALAAKIGSTTRSFLVDIDLQRISDRIVALGGQGYDDAHLLHITRAAKIPDRHRAVYKGVDLAENSKWFYECRKRSIPMVFIETRKKFARLSWDCITIDPSEEGHVRSQAGERLGVLMFQTFQVMTKGAIGKPFFDGSSFVGHIDRLLPETASELADVYFRMLSPPIAAETRAA